MRENRMGGLGVTIVNNSINICVSAPTGDWCRILIREIPKENDKRADWSVYSLKPSPLFKTIYTAAIKAGAGKKYEYIFENENGFFLDPFCRQIKGNEEFGRIPDLSGTDMPGSSDERRRISDTLGLTGIVMNDCYDWKNDKKPMLDFSELFIYKLHVRGFTRSEKSGVKHPGTYSGVCEKIRYMKELGVNAVLLQPCNEFNELMDYQINIGSLNDGNTLMRSRLFKEIEGEQKTRINFWGYGAQNLYFAPKASYAFEPDRVTVEFKNMVRKLHGVGIEVLMEMDFPGDCSRIPVCEVLKFWAMEYHIDGFRLNENQVPIGQIMADPFLSNLKIICAGFCEETLRGCDKDKLAVANDDYQDTMRRFLKGDEGQLSDAAHLFTDNGGQTARVHYIADHNGFTLNDVFCYDERHNEANGEKNEDGCKINYSWNCGTEGVTRKRKILELRQKMLKNAITFLMLGQGVPLLCAGDEFGNTHFGNNNPYCCDNEQGYVNWTGTRQSNELKKLVQYLSDFRKKHICFRNSRRLLENDPDFTGYPDVSFHGTSAWYPDFSYYSRTIGVLLNGEYALDGMKNKDSSFYVVVNMHWEQHEFGLPILTGRRWKKVFGTDACTEPGEEEKAVILQPRSIAVFETEKLPEIRKKRGVRRKS